MARRKKSLPQGVFNKQQKAAFRRGDYRVSRDEIAEPLELSRSDDPGERLVAAQNLCPCHVRTRIDTVMPPYHMMEDGDEKIRAVNWHTLDDGGYPTDDPRMDAIPEKAVRTEQSRRVRLYVDRFSRGAREREEFLFEVANKTLGASDYSVKGKCDCRSESERMVRKDYDNLLSFGGDAGPALICESCDN